MAAMTRDEILAAVTDGRSLYGANLTGANLYGADLTRADLTRANLFGANLTGANLTGANLTGANLTGANLTGANLYGANLTGANGILSVSGVGSDRRTVYACCGPDGWVIRAGCWTGTTAQLRERVAGRPWEDASDADFARWRDQYVAVCDLIDATAVGVS